MENTTSCFNLGNCFKYSLLCLLKVEIILLNSLSEMLYDLPVVVILGASMIVKMFVRSRWPIK